MGQLFFIPMLSTGGGPPSGPAGGDLDGTYPDPTVVGLQTRPIDAAVPDSGDVLAWDGAAWTPTAPESTPTGPAGGDLDGTYPDPTVVGLQTRPVDSAVPDSGDVLAWDGAAWTPTAISSSSAFRLAFTDADLAGGVLPVNHALGQQYNAVTLYSNSNSLVLADTVLTVDANNLSIDLTSFQAANGGTIPGTWNVVVNG